MNEWMNEWIVWWHERNRLIVDMSEFNQFILVKHSNSYFSQNSSIYECQCLILDDLISLPVARSSMDVYFYCLSVFQLCQNESSSICQLYEFLLFGIMSQDEIWLKWYFSSLVVTRSYEYVFSVQMTDAIMISILNRSLNWSSIENRFLMYTTMSHAYT